MTVTAPTYTCRVWAAVQEGARWCLVVSLS